MRSLAGCPNRAADGAPLARGRFNRATAREDWLRGVKPLHSLYPGSRGRGHVRGFLDQKTLHPKFKQLAKVVEAFRTYIVNNGPLIPHYGARSHNGEAIATGFVESTVHHVVRKRFCTKPQMLRSKRGAPLLLQTRVKTLHRELGSVAKHG
jgi:hypothetical protein